MSLALTNLSSISNLDDYIQAVGKLPVLTQEEETELSERYFHHGCLDAARDLIISHLRFVVFIAKSYNGYSLPMADLIQEGNIGLMKAVKRYNPTKGVRLSSFAVHWIRAEIQEFCLRNWKVVKVATTKAQRKLFFNLRRNKNKELQEGTTWLSDEEVNNIAKELNVDVKEVLTMESRLYSHVESFDVEVDEDDTYSPSDYLCDETLDPYKQIEEQNSKDNLEESLREAINLLDERSQDIIKQRWLSEEPCTLQVLADKYGVSASRIQQIEKQAMQKLKSLM